MLRIGVVMKIILYIYYFCGAPGYLRQEFRELELMDEITQLRFEDKLLPLVAIFGSFSSIWWRNKQKETKNGTENDVKNSYRETPGKGNLEKWSKNAFFSPGTVPKR
jgi:hypothetical protein